MAETTVLPALLAHHARTRPAACAVRLAWHGATGTLCYAELAEQAARTAACLWHGHGVRAGDRVAYLGFNEPAQLVLLFALAHIGAALVPLNFRLAPPEWHSVLDDCTPVLLVHDAHWQEGARALGAQAGVATRALHGERASHPAAPAQASAQAPALLVYTSGTTGRPKGALHTQGNLLANMRIAAEVQSITPEDRVLTALPLFHVGGLCIQTLPALHAGAQVLLQPRFDAGALLACIAQDRPTLTLQVPATMKALIEHPAWAATDLTSLRAVWAGSSVLPAPLVAAFLARGVPLCNVYGATETGPFSIALPPAHAQSHAGGCGWPAPGVQARLGAVQAGGVGEVLLRGPNVVSHYWPDTPALDDQGWFHTGDLAVCAADGSYTIVGRAKDMIISGGENIYPAEIENLLSEHPDVAECAVVGMPDAQWGEAVVAAVVPRAGTALDADALQGFLHGRLARYKLPRRIVALQSLPKTALGKVQKNLLQQTLGSLP